LATGSSDLVTWEKHPANPILREDIHGDKVPQHWRDPYVWKDGDRWLMVLCGQFSGERFGSVFLYQSQNLLEWKYVGILAKGTESQGRGWECANYLKLGQKHVLVISPYGSVIYSIGDFDGKQHHSNEWHILDHGKSFYATNTYIDDQGRTILVGWVKSKGDGWNGCLSLPRELQLIDQNQLQITPIEELEQLRVSHQNFERTLENLTEDAGTAPIFGERIEIKARFQLKEADSFGLNMVDDQGSHKLSFDFQAHTMQFGEDFAEMQFTKAADLIELHIFVDHSVIEVFINQREVFTTVFYPKLAETHALKIAPFVKNSRGKFSIDAWKLAETPVKAA
jgi:beta-fructofuranosidase